MLLGVSSLFEMHSSSMHVDLVASLHTLGSGVAQPGCKQIHIHWS